MLIVQLVTLLVRKDNWKRGLTWQQSAAHSGWRPQRNYAMHFWARCRWWPVFVRMHTADKEIRLVHLTELYLRWKVCYACFEKRPPPWRNYKNHVRHSIRTSSSSSKHSLFLCLNWQTLDDLSRWKVKSAFNVWCPTDNVIDVEVLIMCNAFCAGDHG